MATQLFKNNAKSTLAAALGNNPSTDLTVTLAAGDGAKFPTPPAGDFFKATLVRVSDGSYEIVKCTGVTGDTVTVASGGRAQEGTSALAFVVGDKFELRITKETLENFHQASNTTATGEALRTAADAAAARAAISADRVFSVRCYLSAAQNCNNPSVISWDGEFHNEIGASCHSTSVNPSRFTVPAGYTQMRINVALVFAPNATGQRSVLITKNGTAGFTPGGAGMLDASPARPASFSTVVGFSTGWINVTPGEYYEIQGAQDTGAALALNVGQNNGASGVWVEFR